MPERDEGHVREEIAVVGMAGRFPGARTVAELWQNLCRGVESVTFFTPEEVLASGVPPAVLRDPLFVNAAALMDDADGFDAAFFGFNPREAELMDPQHRVFLECAWEALEDAGLDPEAHGGVTGVFGGVGPNTYFRHCLASHPELLEMVGPYQVMVANEGHFPTTRVSYKLNLTGPSLNVQTACSTSAVAIHLACQSLLAGECDTALAGGARIRVPLRGGYVYQPDGIPSPDGHCRPFDAEARGTIYGSGVAIVVLKRLSDALREGHSVHAVIKGSAINNDGSVKVGYTAPGVKGQATVIAEAHAVAEVDPDAIGFVETHGTGTALGDPVEIAALTQAFRQRTDRTHFCALGAVKANIGHLDAAAGVTGVIKAALALRTGLIPPMVNFTRPNPQIDFDRSPFSVSTELRSWKREGDVPRRAGVSSFGLGGTNAHIVLEEPPAEAPERPGRPWQLLLLSARTPAALDAATDQLAEHLAQHPTLDLASAGYTLQVGRKAFGQRRMLVARDAAEAAGALRARDRAQVLTQSAEAGPRPVVFMFPGGGAQYVDMGAELYRTESAFREEVDGCLSRLASNVRDPVRHAMYPAEARRAEALTAIERPSIALPALFTVEYAMARLLVSWGVRPAAMIGHSMGEYTAACLAGVISLSDALALVTLRGQLFERLAPGAMLVVPLPEAEVRALMPGALSMAAVNGPEICVVSGAVEPIGEMATTLAERGVECGRVHISVAAHSSMIEPILDEFARFLGGVRLLAPRIPYVSNVSGTWISAEEAQDVAYWVRHLRQTIRFSDGLTTVLSGHAGVVLEVGPGQTLATLARQHPGRGKTAVVATMRHPKEQTSDVAFLLGSLGRMWLAGASLDWAALHAGHDRRRISLPTYPFERKRHWIDPVPVLSEAPEENDMPSSSREAAGAEDRKARILGELQEVINELSGREASELDPQASFLEMGFDSLFLTRAIVVFQRRLGVKITFRQLFEEAPSLDALAAFIDGKLPPTPAPAAPPPAAPSRATAPVGAAAAESQPVPRGQASSALPAAGGSLMERVIAQQLQLMSQQLELLRAAPPGSSVEAPVTPTAPARPALSPVPATDVAASAPSSADMPPAPKAHGAWKPIDKRKRGPLTPRQREHLDALIERYTRRTRGSKRLTEEQRARLSDPRAVSGFNQQWKEMIYQIAIATSSGGRVVGRRRQRVRGRDDGIRRQPPGALPGLRRPGHREAAPAGTARSASSPRWPGGWPTRSAA